MLGIKIDIFGPVAHFHSWIFSTNICEKLSTPCKPKNDDQEKINSPPAPTLPHSLTSHDFFAYFFAIDSSIKIQIVGIFAALNLSHFVTEKISTGHFLAKTDARTDFFGEGVVQVSDASKTWREMRVGTGT